MTKYDLSITYLKKRVDKLKGDAEYISLNKVLPQEYIDALLNHAKDMEETIQDLVLWREKNENN